jgi:hypothetical protein
MDDLWQAALAWVAGVLTIGMRVAWPALKAWADERQQRAWLAIQERLGGAAARLAAEIAAEVAASPEMRAVSQRVVDTAAAKLGVRFGELVTARGIPPSTLSGMVSGELGKLNIAVRQ